MKEVLAIVVFSAVSSGTSGPNNLLLWASGAAFGSTRTIPDVVGTVLGIGAMALGVAEGHGALVTAIPSSRSRSRSPARRTSSTSRGRSRARRALRRSTIVRQMSLLEAAVFQVIKPKAWILALGAS